VLGHCCENARDVDRKAAESRVLTGLREHMMTPEIAVDTMRLCTEDQLAQPPSVEAHRNSPAASRSRYCHRGDRARHRQGGWHRALSDRLTD
jgi:hypothetical protein